MLTEINRSLSARSPAALAVLSALLVAGIGVIDFLTGYELSFSLFYTIPVAIVSWYVGRRVGLLLCVLSALTWLLVDSASGHQYSHPAIPLWNASVRLGFFVIISYLLYRLRSSVDVQVSLARLDGLTGLLNARTFRRRCEALFALAQRHGHPLVLGYIDLDNFKAVNDRFGHSVGDQVLKAVAGTVSSRLRISDLGARLGGDEFAILLPETDLVGARTFFTGLHRNLVAQAASNHWPVGFSIGVAVFRSSAATPDDAIGLADGLMYRIKQSGKNDIVFEEFTEPPGAGKPVAGDAARPAATGR
jgi:diguanylate cyclase (GGDEF)-like protein